MMANPAAAAARITRHGVRQLDPTAVSQWRMDV